jgi:thermostable 8-oxoguanine DNA glycosylase
MQEFQIKVFKKYINHPLNVRTEDYIVLNRKAFLKYKRSIRKDKTCEYSLTILNGEKEPLLLLEKLQIIAKKIKRRLKNQKTIQEMEVENTKREYIQKKYFWIILIGTLILGSLITILLEDFFKTK